MVLSLVSDHFYFSFLLLNDAQTYLQIGLALDRAKQPKLTCVILISIILVKIFVLPVTRKDWIAVKSALDSDTYQLPLDYGFFFLLQEEWIDLFF